MDKDILEKYKKAGAIAKQALVFGKGLIKENAKVLDIAEAVEKKIIELGGKPAFPVNISINEIAAHYTPKVNDSLVINENDYVKLDVGAHVDGYIGDTACTVRISGSDMLIKCSEKMLENALEMFVPGRKISEIGEAIEKTAKDFGLNPVRNLTGHGLSQYDLHAGIVIPNIKVDTRIILKEGDVFAVEPFCTAGAGMIKDSEPTLIFKYMKDTPVRMIEAKKILNMSKNTFKSLPFAIRWIKGMSEIKIAMALKQLVSSGALHPYHTLKEISNSPVAQSEHTVIVAKEPIITTL